MEEKMMLICTRQTRVQARVFAMDDLLCFVRGAWSSTFIRIDVVLWIRICGYARHGMGLAHCHGFYPVRRYGHGYVCQHSL
jgi:hypothetical protein